MGTVWLASLTSAVMSASDAIFVSLLFLLPRSTPLSCLMPCQLGLESTEELPCHVCPELDANDCQSKELVVGPCGCRSAPKLRGKNVEVPGRLLDSVQAPSHVSSMTKKRSGQWRCQREYVAVQ